MKKTIRKFSLVFLCPAYTFLTFSVLFTEEPSIDFYIILNYCGRNKLTNAKIDKYKISFHNFVAPNLSLATVFITKRKHEN